MMKQFKHILSITILTGFIQIGYIQLGYTQPGSDQPEPLHMVKEKPLAADFTLHDINEEQHKLSQYRGRVVIVNFWATWCPPCRFELPSMDKAYQMLKQKGVVMLAINVGEDADTVFNFTADYPVTFPLLLDKEARVIKQYPVVGLPTSYIIDTQGHIVYRVIGTRDWTDKKLLKSILDLKK
jgi:peroxiredoxin